MKTVWIIDDDEDMARTVALMVKMLNYDVRYFLNARSGAEALLAGQRPNLIILDINMKDVTGLDFLEFLRRIKAWDNLPVVMLTSEPNDLLKTHATALGADAYVLKPVSIEELEKAFKTAYKTRRNAIQNRN